MLEGDALKHQKLAILFNALVFILALIGVVFMVCGIRFMTQQLILETSGWENFKYFTVDSNIFVGMTSLIFLIYVFFKKEIPQWLHILKFMACVGVLLTFFVTAFFLAPTSKFPFFAFYQNSNLFFHFMVPVLSAISFIFFEKRTMPYKMNFLGLVPMGIYAIFYMTSIFTHMENHIVSPHYDFYGFLRAGASSIYYVVPIVFLATYGISCFLWFVSCRKK